ncbi:MAG TPA: hypothetical protein VIU12_23470, partial [Chryseolinea sp.]
MARKPKPPEYSTAEKKALKALPVTIPEYNRRDPFAKGRRSHPFSEGEKIVKYTQATLAKENVKDESRTEFFLETLYGIWAKIGKRRVPYAFREQSGKLRSLDAGCLGYLV